MRGTFETRRADGEARPEPLRTLLGVDSLVARGELIGFSEKVGNYNMNLNLQEISQRQ